MKQTNKKKCVLLGRWHVGEGSSYVKKEKSIFCLLYIPKLIELLCEVLETMSHSPESRIIGTGKKDNQRPAVCCLAYEQQSLCLRDYASFSSENMYSKRAWVNVRYLSIDTTQLSQTLMWPYSGETSSNYGQN